MENGRRRECKYSDREDIEENKSWKYCAERTIQNDSTIRVAMWWRSVESMIARNSGGGAYDLVRDEKEGPSNVSGGPDGE